MIRGRSRVFLFFQEIANASNSLYNVVPIDPGNYTGTELAAHINGKINTVVNLPNFANIYTVN